MALREKIITKIRDHFLQTKDRRIESLFKDSERFKNYSREACGIFLDFSKTNLDSRSLELLKKLLIESSFLRVREDLFQGKKINISENRPALHIFMRSQLKSIFMEGKDVKKEMDFEHQKMEAFCKNVQSGSIRGATGKKFTDIVNIGIGGSQTGPEMIIKALKPFQARLKIHFLSNIDPSDLVDVLEELNPETTLFIVVSKSFKTLETLNNAAFVENWLRTRLEPVQVIDNHFVAVSSNMRNVDNFPVSFKYVFKIHDFVGGRYSFWGSAGISVMLGLGVENFNNILDGGYNMDQHFLDSELGNNLPVLLGLIGVWHSCFCKYPTLAIIPYEKRLEIFPQYIQQLQMESNGKTITKDGVKVSDFFSPIVWGDTGTNCQHSFFQYLHQGLQTVPCEFLVGRSSSIDIAKEHHAYLKLNCAAQSEALMLGTIDEEKSSHKYIEGNKPSTTLIYDSLDPFNLGALGALYEHKVFVEGILLNINSFDQFGVELGKNLVKKYRKDLDSGKLGKSKKSNLSNGVLKQLFR